MIDDQNWITGFAKANVSWSLLQAFAVVARSGAFRTGAIAMGLSINTLRTRIAQAEQIAKRALFVRSVKGCELSDAGKALLARIEQMEASLAAEPN